MAAHRAADNLAGELAATSPVQVVRRPTTLNRPAAIIPPGIRWPIAVRRFSFPKCPFGNKWLDVRLKRFFCDGLDTMLPIGYYACNTGAKDSEHERTQVSRRRRRP